MKKYDVVKANTLTELIEMIKKRMLSGLTALGSPAFIHMRNKHDKRITVYYQAVAIIGRVN